MEIISSIFNKFEYNPSQVKKAMKTLYFLRSQIVHGKEINKYEENIQIGEHSIFFKDLAIKFLRDCIQFMLYNPKYLYT